MTPHSGEISLTAWQARLSHWHRCAIPALKDGPARYVPRSSVTYTMETSSDLTAYRWQVHAVNSSGTTPSLTRTFTSYEPG